MMPWVPTERRTPQGVPAVAVSLDSYSARVVDDYAPAATATTAIVQVWLPACRPNTIPISLFGTNVLQRAPPHPSGAAGRARGVPLGSQRHVGGGGAQHQQPRRRVAPQQIARFSALAVARLSRSLRAKAVGEWGWCGPRALASRVLSPINLHP